MLLQSQARHLQHVRQTLTQMSIHLANVISDVYMGLNNWQTD